MSNARILLIALTASLVLAQACTKATPAAATSAANAPKPVAVQTATVTRKPALRTVEVTGTLFGDIETTVASKLAGRVVRLGADLGDDIATGDVLGTIDARDYELALEQQESAVLATLAQLGLTALPGEGFDAANVPAVRRSRSEADNARAKFERAKQLFDQKPPLIAEQDLADLRTTWEMAREASEAELLAAKALVAKARAEHAAVMIARQRREDTIVRVPAGLTGEHVRFRVAERLVDVGEYMNEGTAMFRLIALDPIRYRASVPERFVRDIQKGQRATVMLEHATDATAFAAAGIVTRIAPRIDEASRSFEVEITIDNPQGALTPGAFARGAIDIRQDQNVLFVPTSAIVTFAGVSRVFSVKDGKAVPHRVTLGQVQGDQTEIISALDATEVVTAGASSLNAGVPVTVQ